MKIKIGKKRTNFNSRQLVVASSTDPTSPHGANAKYSTPPKLEEMESDEIEIIPGSKHSKLRHKYINQHPSK